MNASPMPAFEMLDISRYNRLTVQTSRGCPWRCAFCASSILLTHRYKQKPVAKVLAEIDAIRNLWRRPFIEFADDNAFVNRAWWKQFLPELRNRHVRWFAETDLSVADDEELLELMRDAGCAGTDRIRKPGRSGARTYRVAPELETAAIPPVPGCDRANPVTWYPSDRLFRRRARWAWSRHLRCGSSIRRTDAPFRRSSHISDAVPRHPVLFAIEGARAIAPGSGVGAMHALRYQFQSAEVDRGRIATWVLRPCEPALQRRIHAASEGGVSASLPSPRRRGR